MLRLPSLRKLAVAVFAVAAIQVLSLSPGRAESCREQPVVMISTSWCGYCRKARQFFNDNQIAFEEIDAEQTASPGIRETYRRTGVPLIIIGATEVRGFNERRLREILCVPL
jgi:glutaredoxin